MTRGADRLNKQTKGRAGQSIPKATNQEDTQVGNNDKSALNQGLEPQKEAIPYPTKQKRELARISISIDANVCKWLEEYAEELGIKKSEVINTLLLREMQTNLEEKLSRLKEENA